MNSSLGELLFKKGNLTDAKELFRKSFDYARQENSLELIQKSRPGLKLNRKSRKISRS